MWNNGSWCLRMIKGEKTNYPFFDFWFFLLFGDPFLVFFSVVIVAPSYHQQHHDGDDFSSSFFDDNVQWMETIVLGGG